MEALEALSFPFPIWGRIPNVANKSAAAAFENKNLQQSVTMVQMVSVSASGLITRIILLDNF